MRWQARGSKHDVRLKKKDHCDMCSVAGSCYLVSFDYGCVKFENTFAVVSVPIIYCKRWKITSDMVLTSGYEEFDAKK